MGLIMPAGARRFLFSSMQVAPSSHAAMNSPRITGFLASNAAAFDESFVDFAGTQENPNAVGQQMRQLIMARRSKRSRQCSYQRRVVK